MRAIMTFGTEFSTEK